MGFTGEHGNHQQNVRVRLQQSADVAATGGGNGCIVARKCKALAHAMRLALGTLKNNDRKNLLFSSTRLHGGAWQPPRGPARSGGGLCQTPAFSPIAVRSFFGAKQWHEALAGVGAGRRVGFGHLRCHPHGVAFGFFMAGVPQRAGGAGGARSHAVRQVGFGLATAAPVA